MCKGCGGYGTCRLTASSASVNEGVADVFTVTASKAVEVDTVVKFKLVADSTAANAGTTKANLNDFNAGSFNEVSVTILKGQTTATTSISAITNDGTELSETYSMTATIGTTVLTTSATILDGSVGSGQNFTLTTGMDVIPGLVGSNGNTVTSGNDNIIGMVALKDVTGTATLDTPTTFNDYDMINGGEGVNTFKLSVVGLTTNDDWTVNLANLEKINILETQSTANLGSGNLILDASTVTGLTNLNVTKYASDLDATASATTDVLVSGKATAAKLLTVSGGNNVTVKLTDVLDAATVENDITIGGAGAAAAKGAVIVEATAKAAADSVDVVMGAISVTGGKTISVTQKVGDASALVAGGTSPDHTQGAVAIVTDATTTAVTVKQDLAATAKNGAVAIAGVNEVVSVKFVGLAIGETMSLGDGTNKLTLTASKIMTAADVAVAFANLSADAIKATDAAATTATGDTQGSGSSVKGIFTGDGLAGWNSAAAIGDTVVFTAKASGTTGLADGGGTKSAVLTTTTSNVTKVDGSAAVLGVVVGDVDITGGAALATLTVDSFATGSEIHGAANNALATVNLSNGANFTIDSAASALALNLTNISGTVAVTAGTTTLNATVTSSSTSGTTTLTSGSATAVKVSGTGIVAGTTATGLTAATSINTTGMTAGNAIFTIASGTTTTYTGGAAADSVTVSDAGTAITKAIDLGAGSDTLTLVGATVAVPTAILKGGEGVDTLSIDVASAAALDGATLFAAKLDSFEHLTLNSAGAGAEVIDLANLGFANYVTTSGSGGTLTLDKLANNGTVVLTAAPTTGTTVKITDAAVAGHDTDVLNVIAQVSSANIDHKVVTVASVETINITSQDTIPVTAGSATIDTNTLTLLADTVTSVKIDGNANLTLTLNAATVALATIDAGTLTGALTVTAMDTALEMTITGGSGNDVLQASGVSKSVIKGGLGNDTIVAGTVSSDLWGGDGNDLFILKDLNAATALGGNKDADSYSIIQDFKAGDLLQLMATITAGATTAATSFNKLVTTLQDDTAALSSFANAAMKQIDDAEATAASTVGDAVWFNFKGNAYVVVDNAADSTGTFVAGEDLIIRLLGVDGN